MVEISQLGAIEYRILDLTKETFKELSVEKRDIKNT
jgi:hypothetical protein